MNDRDDFERAMDDVLEKVGEHMEVKDLEAWKAMREEAPEGWFTSEELMEIRFNIQKNIEEVEEAVASCRCDDIFSASHWLGQYICAAWTELEDMDIPMEKRKEIDNELEYLVNKLDDGLLEGGWPSEWRDKCSCSPRYRGVER